MIPPTSIDGTDISGATIDGTDVTEITVDGDTVFTAGPNTGMDHFYFAPDITSVGTWPDQEGGEDATSVGNPRLSDINGTQAVDLDGNDLYETSNPLPLGPSSEWTVLAVIEPDGGDISFVGNGASGGYHASTDFGANRYRVLSTGIAQAFGGTPTTNPQIIVISYDGTNVILDVDKTEVINASLSTPAAADTRFVIGARGNKTFEFDGKIGAIGHSATASNSTRRDELTDIMADEFNITV